MRKVDIRDRLVAHMSVLLDQWKVEGRGIECHFENQEDLDLNKVADQFIVFFLNWNPTRQKNVAENPDVRYYGDVVIMLFGKSGTGTRDRLILEDEISEHFKFKALSGVTTKEPTPSTAPGRSEKHEGWHSATVTFPFFADSDVQ